MPQMRKRGHPRLNKGEPTDFVGFKCPLPNKLELERASERLGINTSVLVRAIVFGWLKTFEQKELEKSTLSE